MMQMVPKWLVIVVFPGREIRFWVHDNFLSNVQHTVANLSFSENGMEQPTRIDISAVSVSNQQVGTTLVSK